MSQELSDILSKRREIIRNKNSIKRIIEERRRHYLQKPQFLRWLWWKFPKFENRLKWKRPRGKDNPVRLHLKGYPAMATTGYGTKSDLRYLHPSGLRPIVVHSVRELDSLDPSKYVVYISSSLGLKKRLEVAEKARMKGFKIANM